MSKRQACDESEELELDHLEVMGVKWNMSPKLLLRLVAGLLGDALWPGPVVLALVKDSRG